jgi:hypothetical protein
MRRAGRWVYAAACWVFQHLSTIKALATLAVMAVLFIFSYAVLLHVRIGDTEFKYERVKPAPKTEPPAGEPELPPAPSPPPNNPWEATVREGED